jgi:uncharacterized protein YgbK (DUF1537 family)
VIADDLTGACDAAVHFAARNYRVRACLDDRFSGIDVAAVSTETRKLLRKDLRAVFPEILRRYPAARARCVFKKIDSTLRGNAGLETLLAARVFACDAVVVTPAFPALNRIVEGGMLRVPGTDFEPVDLGSYWRSQGVADVVHVSAGSVAGALSSGCRFVSAEAVSDLDLDAIAAAGIASGKRVLWAGSGGLASALARALPARSGRLIPRRASHSAMLFCVGSRHAVTAEQHKVLIETGRVFSAEAANASREAITGALRDGHAALAIELGIDSETRLKELMETLSVPLLLTGGDTAALVCRALGVQGIRIECEIAPGIPRGIIEGGAFDGLPVATKSGGFGGRDALIRVANALTCLKL